MLSEPTNGPLGIGLYAVNAEPMCEPGILARIAPLAENLGYDSLWVGDHPVLPDPPDGSSPFGPGTTLADPVVVLSFLAGITTRVRLCTGLVVLPLRQPIVLAKQLASLDVLSRGRLTFGFGMGYIPAEAAAAGICFAERGARGTEYLCAMRSLWYDEKPAFHGRYVDFSDVNAFPRPLQKELRVVTGGHTPAAYRRAVTQAHGWYGFLVRPDEIACHVVGLRQAGDRHPRPAHLGPLEVTVTPRGQLTSTGVKQFREAGVDRLVMYPRAGLDVTGLEDYLRQQAQLVAHA